MINSQVEVQEELNRLSSRWGDKAFGPEILKRIRFYTKNMKAKDIRKMVSFFLDNNKFSPLPREFGEYARSHGFSAGRKEPATPCHSCKNKGSFIAVKYNYYKYFFDCPQVCDWNIFHYGRGKKNPWNAKLRDRGFALEHELIPRNEEMTDMMANSITMGFKSFAKKVLKGSGYDDILNDYERSERDRGKNKGVEI